MSDEEEGFLNRWSRRKQDAAKETARAEAEKPAEVAPAVEDSRPEAKLEEPEFDVSTLPPIDTITAGTDIRAFLSKGVPAALTQAALRRAWSADPAIRDYIGLSEYSWDFNSPGVHGFGPLDPSLNIQDMVADVFGKVKHAVAETEAVVEKADSLAPQTESAFTPMPPSNSVELREEKIELSSEAEIATTAAAENSGDKTAQSDVAPQQQEPEIAELPVQPRRHGSALPS